MTGMSYLSHRYMVVDMVNSDNHGEHLMNLEHEQGAGIMLDNVKQAGEEASALAGLYRLVSRCLEEEIDSDVLRLLRSTLAKSLEGVGWHLDQDFLERPEEEILTTLAEEYTGLFVAPGGISPYASVFETGCMYREPCDQATNAYREAGWEYQRCMSGEFSDHVGTMLAFLGELAATEAEALESGEIESADLARQRRDKFLLDQLGSWVPGWCQRASEVALLPFYKQLLEFTEQLLWQELAAVTDRRRLKELAVLNQREPKKLDYDADFRKASGI